MFASYPCACTLVLFIKSGSQLQIRVSVFQVSLPQFCTLGRPYPLTTAIRTEFAARANRK